MGIDQADEQSNKFLKMMVVYRIIDNPTDLLKWATCWPVMCHILEKDGEEEENLLLLHYKDL